MPPTIQTQADRTSEHDAPWVATEADAQRLADSAAGRYWLVVNESVRNAHERPVGYELVPGPSTLPPLRPDAPALRRAEFATRRLWVTAHDPGQSRRG